MAKQVKLIARPRTESGRNSVKTVRARGAVPAVIYGARTTPSNLEVTRRDIEVILSLRGREHPRRSRDPRRIESHQPAHPHPRGAASSDPPPNPPR